MISIRNLAIHLKKKYPKEKSYSKLKINSNIQVRGAEGGRWLQGQASSPESAQV